MSPLRQSAAAAAVVALLTAQGTAAECPNGPKLVTELGRREQVPMPFAPGPGGVETYPPAPQANARYLRALVEAKSVPECQWFLNVRDADYRLQQVLDKSDFASGAPVWTHRVAGGSVLFDLQRCTGGQGPTVKLLEYMWMPKDAKAPYYSKQGATAAYRPITEADTGRRRTGDSTGFLMASWDRTYWACSGVMLTPELFLTNWHCGGPPGLDPAGYWTGDIVRGALIDLSFDGDAISRELVVTALVDKDRPLDYAILRTRASDELGPVRPVAISSVPVAASQHVQVVHHPEAKTKQLSWNCVVQQAEYAGWKAESGMSDFTHTCDTEGGSSGGPVLDENGALVGLHHLGFRYDEAACQQTDKENKAIKITAILARLRDDPAKKAIYDEIERAR